MTTRHKRLLPDLAGVEKVAPPSDILYGAKAIAEHLKLFKQTADGASVPDEKKVYRLREKNWPIIKAPGVGLCARAKSLDAFLARMEPPSVKRDSEHG